MSHAILMDIEPATMHSARAGHLLEGPYWPLLDPIGPYWTPLAPSGSYLVLLDLLLVPIGPYIVRGELVHVQGGQCARINLHQVMGGNQRRTR